MEQKVYFKKKKNGVHRAQLVSKDYNQISRTHFQYNFTPVTSEGKLRILLVMWVVKDYFAEVVDVQTTFLHGDIEEEQFIKIPFGYKEFLRKIGQTITGNFLRLEKSAYGLVQAAQSW